MKLFGRELSLGRGQAARPSRVEPTVSMPRRPRHRYEAAEVTNLTASWTGTPRPPATLIKESLTRLRARVRQQARDNDHVRKALSIYRSNVVGPEGVRLQAKTVNANGSIDATARRAIESDFARWGAPGVCDVTGRHSWVDLQNLAINSLLIDGEVLWLHRENWTGNPFGYAIQVLDPALIDHRYDRDLGNGRAIRGGIEYDRYGRMLALHLIDHSHKNEDYQTAGQRRTRIPADRVTHAFLSDFGFQGRGVSAFAAALMRLRMLHEYEDAELIAATTAAKKMGFFEDGPDGEKYLGDEVETSDGEEDRPLLSIEESGFGRIPHGAEFHQWDPQHPNGVFPQFVQATIQAAGAGLDVPYHMLANDPKSVNFSSMRGVALEYRPLWQGLQRWMREHVLQTTFDRWLEAALLREQITVGGSPLAFGRIEKYRAIAWRPRGWEHVQPREQQEADRGAVAMRTKSISRVIRDRGDDPEDVFQEIADDFARLRELGIEPKEVLPDEDADEAPGDPDEPAGTAPGG